MVTLVCEDVRGSIPKPEIQSISSSIPPSTQQVLPRLLVIIPLMCCRSIYMHVCFNLQCMSFTMSVFLYRSFQTSQFVVQRPATFFNL